ncbi:bifunctional phosphatase PAP2/diacylglycerol kinase family protein [Rhodococcus sp. NBC_00294]|uniref:bifunctional phosphatase PAP2/diacylglycerol kinase family protein n=2 Tax=Rhodococcus TaxID=1827 RepID=UPI0027E15CA5|nr:MULTISPECIES: phosphatase PAP2 family protein [unclassified Rhodococcus (in: high G+C Gram-positive bacteria)]
MNPRSLRGRTRSVDLALVKASFASRPSGLDPALRTLTGLADHSVLWAIVASALAASGGPRRRGAVRGMLAVVGASSLANGVLKPLLPRDRPPAASVPALRRIMTPPVSSSFPSGHAASAAAFATGVALEAPLAGLLVAPLAATVAYSRVHVGVHWPSDVVVGAALGVAVALSTRRWWAVRSTESAELGPAGLAPALHEGEGMLVLVNPGAGTHNSEVVADVAKALPRARFLEPDADDDFTAQFVRAAGSDVLALGVCGGDGTVAAAVAAAVRTGLPLAVFPGGTLNHFARDVGAVEVSVTADAVTRGASSRVDLGGVSIDGGEEILFVNTASIGGYPDSVRLRDKWSSRIGKWPAAAAAMVAVLAVAEPMHVEIDGRRDSVWMMFVGNGTYTPGDQVPMSRPSIASGVLDVRFLRAHMRLSRTRLALAAMTGTLGTSPTYRHLRVPAVSVRNLQTTVAVAVDGEVAGEGRAFDYRARPSLLTLYGTGTADAPRA